MVGEDKYLDIVDVNQETSIIPYISTKMERKCCQNFLIQATLKIKFRYKFWGR